MEAAKKKTYYQLILDRSGSMSNCIIPTISGFNEQVQMLKEFEQKFPEQEINVGLTVFNQQVQQSFVSLPPQLVSELTVKSYVPSGGTALLDAIGETVMSLRSRIDDELRAGIATVVVVILTDGYENASRVFNLSGIRNLVSELEATGLWTFTYMGATFDAVQVAVAMNIKRENSRSFEKEKMGSAFTEVNESLEDYMLQKRQGFVKKNFFKR